MRRCDCGSNEHSSWVNDARGIPLCRTCPECHDRKMAKYRPDVLTDSDYWTDEPVDEDY